MSDSRIDQWSAVARKIGKFPADWHAWYFEKVVGGLMVKGARCAPVARGPRKGEPNYRKRLSEVSTVFIPRSKLPK